MSAGASADTKIAWVIAKLTSGYLGEEGRAECAAVLMEARAELMRQVPMIKNADVRARLMGPDYAPAE